MRCRYPLTDYDGAAATSAVLSDAKLLAAHYEGQTTVFSDGSFHPTTPVSRQAFAAYLYRLEHNGVDG